MSSLSLSRQIDKMRNSGGGGRKNEEWWLMTRQNSSQRSEREGHRCLSLARVQSTDQMPSDDETEKQEENCLSLSFQHLYEGEYLLSLSLASNQRTFSCQMMSQLLKSRNVSSRSTIPSDSFLLFGPLQREREKKSSSFLPMKVDVGNFRKVGSDWWRGFFLFLKENQWNTFWPVDVALPSISSESFPERRRLISCNCTDDSRGSLRTLLLSVVCFFPPLLLLIVVCFLFRFSWLIDFIWCEKRLSCRSKTRARERERNEWLVSCGRGGRC